MWLMRNSNQFKYLSCECVEFLQSNREGFLLQANQQTNKNHISGCAQMVPLTRVYSVCSIIVPRPHGVSVSPPVQREVAAPDGVMISWFIALLPRSHSRGSEISELDLEASLASFHLFSASSFHFLL